MKDIAHIDRCNSCQDLHRYPLCCPATARFIITPRLLQLDRGLIIAAPISAMQLRCGACCAVRPLLSVPLPPSSSLLDRGQTLNSAGPWPNYRTRLHDGVAHRLQCPSGLRGPRADVCGGAPWGRMRRGVAGAPNCAFDPGVPTCRSAHGGPELAGDEVPQDAGRREAQGRQGCLRPPPSSCGATIAAAGQRQRHTRSPSPASIVQRQSAIAARNSSSSIQRAAAAAAPANEPALGTSAAGSITVSRLGTAVNVRRSRGAAAAGAGGRSRPSVVGSRASALRCCLPPKADHRECSTLLAPAAGRPAAAAPGCATTRGRQGAGACPARFSSRWARPDSTHSSRRWTPPPWPTRWRAGVTTASSCRWAATRRRWSPSQPARSAAPAVDAASELDARRGAASSVNPEPYSCHEAKRRRGGAPPSLELLSTAACDFIHTRGCCRRQHLVSRVSSQAPLAGSGPLGSPQNPAIASQLVRLEPHLNIRLG